MGKVISIAQQKGGVGKSMIAVHLAVIFSQQAKKVALLDTDPQGSSSQWYKCREQYFGEGYTGMKFTAVPGWRIDSEIHRLRNHYDIIIIDSPPHIATEAKLTIRAADLVIIPLQPSPPDIWATAATLELTHKENIPAYILINRLPPNSKLAQNMLKDLKPVLNSTLGNRTAFAASLVNGLCVTETQPSSIAAAEIKSLATEISNILYGDEYQELYTNETSKELEDAE